MLLERYSKWLEDHGKSTNTIRSYKRHLTNYSKWFHDSFDEQIKKIYRENVLDYISFMANIKRVSAKTINAQLAALASYNEFLMVQKLQDNIVITKKDYIKIQTECISPASITRSDVESFRQKILENKSNRDYAIVTLLAYSGMRISEALNIRLDDINLTAREILVRYGKGKKQRVVIVNDKIVNALREYLQIREQHVNSGSEYLFISRESSRLDRTTVNRFFNNCSSNITPHSLRHFFCSYALANGWSTHEVAAQVGHSNIHTTMIYTHPSRNEIKRKANLL